MNVQYRRYKKSNPPEGLSSLDRSNQVNRNDLKYFPVHWTCICFRIGLVSLFSPKRREGQVYAGLIAPSDLRWRMRFAPCNDRPWILRSCRTRETGFVWSAISNFSQYYPHYNRPDTYICIHLGNSGKWRTMRRTIQFPPPPIVVLPLNLARPL